MVGKKEKTGDFLTYKQLRLVSLQSMRFLTFSEGTTFLLPLISFVPVLRLSRPDIQTSEWVQYSTLGLLLSCKSRCGYLLHHIKKNQKQTLVVSRGESHKNISKYGENQRVGNYKITSDIGRNDIEEALMQLRHKL